MMKEETETKRSNLKAAINLHHEGTVDRIRKGSQLLEIHANLDIYIMRLTRKYILNTKVLHNSNISSLNPGSDNVRHN